MVSDQGTEFRVRLPIRWEDVDPAGIIFFGNYFRLFQFAEEELFRARGLPLHKLLSELHVWIPRVETHATFPHPARFGDILEVTLRVASVGNSSVRYEFEMDRVDPKPVVTVARGYTAIVVVSQETLRPVRVPKPMRDLLAGKTLQEQERAR